MEVGQESPIELSESQASRALTRKSVLRSLGTGHGNFRLVGAMVVEPDDPARTVREARGPLTDTFASSRSPARARAIRKAEGHRET